MFGKYFNCINRRIKETKLFVSIPVLEVEGSLEDCGTAFIQYSV
jgi:hypothetical protein